MRLNSLGEDDHYRVVVVGSIPTVATKWFVAQLDQSTGLLHRELRVRVSPGQQRMNSLTAEQRFVKPPVESSSLSSSAFAYWVQWFAYQSPKRRVRVPEVLIGVAD